MAKEITGNLVNEIMGKTQTVSGADDKQKNRPQLLELDATLMKEVLREATQRKIDGLKQPTESAVIRDAIAYYKKALKKGAKKPNLSKELKGYRAKKKTKSFYISAEDVAWVANEKMDRVIDEEPNAHVYSIIEEAIYVYTKAKKAGEI